MPEQYKYPVQQRIPALHRAHLPPTMLAYTPAAYHHQPISPHQTYISAIRRAAEAEYVAVLAHEEALKQQELAHRQAAEAIARERQIAQQYDPYRHLNAIQHRLAALRIQQQEQHRVEAVRIREEEQQARAHAHAQLLRQQAQARLLEQQKRQFQASGNGSRDLLELLFGQQVQAPQRQQQTKATRSPPPSQERDILELLFGGESQPTRRVQEPAPVHKCAPPAPASVKPNTDESDLIKLLFGGQAQHKACVPTSKPAPVEREKTAPSSIPSSSDIEDTVRSLLFSLGVNPTDCNVRIEKKPETTPAPAACAPTVEKEAKPDSKLRATDEASLLEQLLQGRAPVESPEIHHTLQGLFNTLTQSQQTPRPNATAGSSKPSAPSSSSSLTTAPSLVERLEQRLKNEEDEEVRDTLQGLVSSFFASHEAKASPVAAEPSSVTVEMTPSLDTAPLAPVAEPSAPSESVKGKDKEVEPEAEVESPPSLPTTADVEGALESIHNIESAFRTLENNFIFPLRLDFEPSSPSFEPADITSPKLAFTATNAPVRFYEHALSLLLTQLDAVESFGDAGVRSKRRETVSEIEKALEEVETEVEGRGRVYSRKNIVSESSPAPIEQVVDAPSPATDLASTPAVDAEDSMVTVVPTAEEGGSTVNLEEVNSSQPETDSTPHEAIAVSEDSVSSSPSSIASSLPAEETVHAEVAPSSSDEGGEWTRV